MRTWPANSIEPCQPARMSDVQAGLALYWWQELITLQKWKVDYSI